MSYYILPPPPSIAIGENTLASWHGGFTEEELDKIVEIGDKLALDPATVGNADDPQIDGNTRKSLTGWIMCNDETQFIYEKLGWISRQINGQFFDFDIWGFNEHLQYTVYNGEDEGHYTWHLDRGGVYDGPRKLSLVLQLSDPEDYDGGDLQIMDKSEPTVVKKEKGLITAFPSFVLHRVTPVTRGIRKTLVIWLTGPKFR